MSDLMTEVKPANSSTSQLPMVACQNTTGTGRVISGLKQFRDMNIDLCSEVSELKAYALHPGVIQITPGFNSREMGMGMDYYLLPEVAEHIANIKAAFIRGDYVDPIRIRIIDGAPFVRQGHCRLLAAQGALAEGHDITIRATEIKEDEIGCELATVDGNRGMALSPVALGESYRRLYDMGGWSLERIAQREGKSATAIKALIRLTSIPVYLKKLIHADAISYVAVLDLLDQFGETEAISRIEKLIAELEEASSKGVVVRKTRQGQVRLRPSDFKAPRIPPVLATRVVEGVKVINDQLLQKLNTIELPEITDSSVDVEIPVTLNRSTIELLRSLASEITASENKALRRAEKRQAKLNGGSDSGNDDSANDQNNGSDTE